MQLQEEYENVRKKLSDGLPSIMEYIAEQKEVLEPWLYGGEKDIVNAESEQLIKIVKDIASSDQNF